MSTESVGARIVREGKEKGLSVNDIRMQLAAIYPAASWKGRQTGNYLPWETSVRKQFEDLLKSDDRERNFIARIKYYKEQDLLRSTDQYLLTLLDGNYSVYVCQTGPFPIAYTIGLHYIFDLPEILIAFKDGQFNNTTFMDLGNLVNATARRLLADEKSVTENTSATSIFKRFQQDSVFRKLTPNEQKDYMSNCTWFYRNFADTEEYPVLALFVSVEGEKPEDPLINTAYERDENVSYFAHKRVTEMPKVDPVDPTQLMMAELIRTRWIISPKQFADLSDFKITDPEKYSQAAGGCSLEVLKKVVEASPFDVKTFDNEASPIEYAIMNERYDNAKYLISLGAKLGGNGETRTALMNACQYGVEEGVHVLVEGGAPLEDTDEENWTALSIASKGILHGDIEKAKRIVEYLWEKGARMM